MLIILILILALVIPLQNFLLVIMHLSGVLASDLRYSLKQTIIVTLSMKKVLGGDTSTAS